MGKNVRAYYFERAVIAFAWIKVKRGFSAALIA
jgi:hypothetical protein